MRITYAFGERYQSVHELSDIHQAKRDRLGAALRCQLDFFSWGFVATAVRVLFLSMLVAMEKGLAPWRSRQNRANRRFAGVS